MNTVETGFGPGGCVATVAAFAVSIWSLATTEQARWFARAGVSLAAVSLTALIVVGAAFAAADVFVSRVAAARGACR